MMKRGVLYFRMRLPKALADRWQKREIRQKIPSRSLQKVEQVCKLLREQLKGFFTVPEKWNGVVYWWSLRYFYETARNSMSEIHFFENSLIVEEHMFSGFIHAGDMNKREYLET